MQEIKTKVGRYTIPMSKMWNQKHSWLYSLAVLLLHCSFLFICFFFFSESTFHGVHFFRVKRGRKGCSNSFLLRKQNDKTKIQPHISFIVYPSSSTFSVYTGNKINTDGIEQSSLLEASALLLFPRPLPSSEIKGLMLTLSRKVPQCSMQL